MMFLFVVGFLVGVFGAAFWVNKRKRVLIVLDLNGVLLHRMFSREALNCPPPQHSVGNFHVWVRPGVDEFLDFVFEHFDVAVWSSARRYNIEPLVSLIFKDRPLVFVWDQSFCLKDGFLDEKPLFLKQMSTIEHFFPHYSGRVLLIDDDPLKMRLNAPGTSIHPPSWDVWSKDGLQNVQAYLKLLRGCESVAQFVLENPFK